MTTTITLLLTLLQPFAASTGVSDLCADVLLKSSGEPITDIDGTTLARFCEWTGEGAPLWADDVCCNIHDQTADCTPTDQKGRCQQGAKMYCKYGEQLANGSVTCYQPFPSAAGPGSGTIQSTVYIQAEVLCCDDNGCHEWTSDSWSGDCDGQFDWCWYGYMNEDGTVDCWG